MLKKISGFMLAIFLAGCTSSGPQATLDELAKAMDTNNPSLFLAQFDMSAFARNYVANATRSDRALNAINELGRMLGLGDVDSLLDSVLDYRAQLAEDFEKGVASGELMASCSRSEKPDCPWVPRSLREAEVFQLSQTSAIAKIRTPTRLTSWLVLRHIDGQWKIIGTAVMESRARELAADPAESKPATPSPVEL